MLVHLKIQNYALIQHLSIDFRKHLNILTGETGAGKSIILGALGLILGKRADTSVLFSSSSKCVVEGSFHVKDYNFHSFFEENDLDYDDLTLMRREISPSGKSRAFINDTPVTLSQLKILAEKLIDIHSQHQTLQLSDSSFKLSVIDVLAGTKELLNSYRLKYSKYLKLQQKLLEMQEEEKQLQRDQDYYLFQLNEIKEASFSENEQQQLEEEQKVLGNAENIKLNIEKLLYLLDDSEPNVNSLLSEGLKSLQEVATCNKLLGELNGRLEQVVIEVKDICNELKQFGNNVFVDNERLQEIEERLDQIYKICRKHKVNSLDELFEYAATLEEKTAAVTSLNLQIQDTDHELKKIETELKAEAGQLSDKREKQFNPFSRALQQLLQQVGIPDAVFNIENKKEAEIGPQGYDKIDFLFSANKGNATAPVGQAASGGELSRIMLCLKYLISGKTALPTLVFDEIDSGVSGETAIQVGKMIRQISENHQIMCITHLPQIAAMGNYHYLVYKQLKENYTYTFIKELSDDARQIEIAKMIAGSEPSETAMKNARELMDQAR